MEISPASPIVRAPSRAAQYVRMSTEHQQYSPENQLDVIRQYAADHIPCCQTRQAIPVLRIAESHQGRSLGFGPARKNPGAGAGEAGPGRTPELLLLGGPGGQRSCLC
jgi:hypothetical protein